MAALSLTRRRLLQSAGAVGALASAPALAAKASQALLVYDSRLAESAGFAAQHGASGLDVAQGLHPRRLALGNATALEGMTGWSDYVALRGALRLQGFRPVAERKVEAPLSGAAHLFRWRLERA
jgi:hypothetical protein